MCVSQNLVGVIRDQHNLTDPMKSSRNGQSREEAQRLEISGRKFEGSVPVRAEVVMGAAALKVPSLEGHVACIGRGLP